MEIIVIASTVLYCIKYVNDEAYIDCILLFVILLGGFLFKGMEIEEFFVEVMIIC